MEVHYRNSSSKREFHENRLSGNHTSLKDGKKLQPVLSIILQSRGYYRVLSGTIGCKRSQNKFVGQRELRGTGGRKVVLAGANRKSLSFS